MRGMDYRGSRSAGLCFQSAAVLRIYALTVSILVLGALAGCQTHEQRVAQQADNLAAAGFLVKPANTPERQACSNDCHPISSFRNISGDDVHYVLADPLVCGCLYVGTQQAYNQYRRDQQQRHLADEQALNAQMYADSYWNWNAWGALGPGLRLGVRRTHRLVSPASTRIHQVIATAQ